MSVVSSVIVGSDLCMCVTLLCSNKCSFWEGELCLVLNGSSTAMFLGHKNGRWWKSFAKEK